MSWRTTCETDEVHRGFDAGDTPRTGDNLAQTRQSEMQLPRFVESAFEKQRVQLNARRRYDVGQRDHTTDGSEVQRRIEEADRT